MPTITTLIGVMVVIGLALAGLLLFVKVLANLASRNEQNLRVDLDARRLRLKVLIEPTRSRSIEPSKAPDEIQSTSRSSEKAS